MTLDPLRLSAREAKRLLVDGEISSAELTKVYLDQIAAVEGKVRAYILVTPDNAAKYSTKVDREMQAMRGPLAGMPVAVKDNMVTAGAPPRAPRRSSTTTSPSTTRPWCARCSGRRTWSSSARPTSTSSRWAPRTENSAFQAHRQPVGPQHASPAARSGGSAAAVAAGEALWRARLRHRRLHPPAGVALRHRRHEADLRRASAATGWSRSPARSTRSGRSRAPSTTARSCCSDLAATTRATPRASSCREPTSRCLPPNGVDGLRIGVPPSTSTRASTPGVRARFDEALARSEELGATCLEISLPHTEYGVAGVLHHRAGRGLVEPRALRRRPLRPPLRRRRPT